MESSLNPYQSPAPENQCRATFWVRVLDFFRGNDGIRSRFLAGEGLFQFGVLFFVNPDDMTTIHAAIPLSETSEPRMMLAINEVKTELVKMLYKYKELQDDLRGRQLCVRFIHDYRDLEHQVCDPVYSDWIFVDPDHSPEIEKV